MAIGVVEYPVILPSKIKSACLSVCESDACEIILSFNFSVNAWLKVGLTIGALFGKYLTENVLMSGETLAPVMLYFIVQPIKTGKKHKAKNKKCEVIFFILNTYSAISNCNL
jgi:hypothetical protein